MILQNFSLLKAQLYFDEFSVATNRSLYKSMTKMTDSVSCIMLSMFCVNDRYLVYGWHRGIL